MSRSAFRIAPLALALALPALMGCPSPGSVGFSVYPNAFDFGPSSVTDSFTVYAQGSGTVHWQAEDLPAWLQLSAMSGTAGAGGQLVTMTVDRSGLSTGTYSGEFRLVAGESQRVVAVSMSVSGSPLPPSLQVVPAALEFGPQDSSRSFVITNTGGGTLNWSLSESLSWLTCSLTAGTVSGGTDSDTVTVSVDRSGLTPGVHTGTIELGGNGGEATVTVSVAVSGPAPVLTVSPLSLSYGTTVTTRDFVVGNTGTAPLNWTLSEDLPWLTLSAEQGQLASGNTPITATVNRANLAPGTYSGTIAVASDGGNATIQVSMTVAETALVVSPTLLQFGSYSTNKLIAVGNDGGGTVNWTIDTGAFPSWLDVAQTSGSVTAGTSGVVVSVDRTGIAPGSYEHTFTVASNGGSEQVRVTMTVPATPILTIDTGFLTTNDQSLLPLGDSETESTFTIRNTGTGTLDWSLDPSALPEWLSIWPVAGSITTGMSLIQVNVSRANLTPGGYTFDVPIVSNGGHGLVEVTMQVPLRPLISVDPPEINFGLEGETGAFYVANVGDPGTILNFLAVSDKAWLFHSPSTGSSVGIGGPVKDWQQVNIAIDRGGLESSGATGRITVYAVDAKGEIIVDIAPTVVKVSVESAPLSFEAAPARTRIPSLVRHIFIMRDFRDRAIVAQPSELLNAFTIFEDGVALELTETSQFVTSPDKLRTNIVVLMDYSGSMLSAVNAIGMTGPTAVTNLYKQVAGDFIDSLPAPWRVSLMEFHDRRQTSRVIHDFTTDRAALHAALGSHVIEDYGASEVLLALREASDHLVAADFPLIAFDDADVRAVVLISDGRTTTPPGDIEVVIRELTTAGVRVFPIGWGLDVDNEPLARLASKSGGHFYPTYKDVNGLPSLAQLQARAQTLSEDLRAQVVLSYTTLNEEESVNVRINASFNPPNDVPDQGIIQGTLSQVLDYSLLYGDVKLGQLSMHSGGIVNGTAEVVVRAEYIPRNINKFRLTFSSSAAFNVSVVPDNEGGILGGWTLTNEGGGSYLLQAPSPLAVLPYGRFGDMVRLSFPMVNSDTLDVFLSVDNLLYLGDIEPKYFLYPDYMQVETTANIAPAFPTLMVKPRSFDFGTDLDSTTFDIVNIGGAYPHGVAEPIVQLNWKITDKPSWLLFDIEEGHRDTAYGSDTITGSVNRSIAPGRYSGYVILEQLQEYPVPLAGEQTIFVSFRVLPPQLDVSTNMVNLDNVQTEGQFLIANTGQSTLDWTIATQTLPDWLTVDPTTGATTMDAPSSVTVEVTPAGLAPGVYMHVLQIDSNAGADTVTVFLTVP